MTSVTEQPTPFGRLRVWYPQLDSTMGVAATLAARGAPHGTVVEAGFQFAGRGRHGRDWEAPAGSALLTSWILRAPAGHDTGVLSPLIALALLRAVRHLNPAIPVGYKWPNDVYVAARKVAGILLTTRVADDEAVLIAGIGVNLHRPSDGPDDRTWLSDWISGQTSDTVREALGNHLAEMWQRYLRAEQLSDEDRQGLVSAMVWRDELVGVRMATGELRGRMIGIATDGSLVLQPDGGAEPVILRTGEVVRGPRIDRRTGSVGAVYFPEQETGCSS